MTHSDPGGCRLRLATVEDAAAIEAIYAPIVRETIISFEWEPPDADEMRERIRSTLRRLPWIVAVDAEGDDAEAILGYASASPYRLRAAYQWSVEVSAYVAQRARRRGVARRLYDALHVLLRFQHYRVSYAIIALPNPASVGFHEALGFERIGVFPAAGFKLGAWHDVLWMRRELGPAGAAPSATVPLGDLGPGVIRGVLSG